jgi:hypothetical protein
MNADAAQGWFIAGTAVAMFAGGGHVLLTLIDTVRPTFFAPIEQAVKPAMEGTGMRFRGLFPGDEGRPSMWSFWLGFNLSHGLGVFTFGLLGLLIAVDDFGVVERIDAIQPLAIAFSAAYLVISLRYWFFGPAILTAIATACFSVSAAVTS